MRTAKKVMAAILAAVMVLPLMVAAWAAEEISSYPGSGKLSGKTANFTVRADLAKPGPGGDCRLVTFHIFVESVDNIPIRAFSFNLEPSEGLELADSARSSAQEANFYYDYPTPGLIRDTRNPNGLYGEFAYSDNPANPKYFAAAGSDEGKGITSETEVFTIVGKVTQPGAYALNLTKVVAGDGNTSDGVADQFKRVVTSASVTVDEIAAKATVSGTVKSYGDAAAAVTITLMKGDVVIAERSGTGTNTAYAFEAVPAGTYTLKVEKAGHAPWSEGVTVEDTDITRNLTVYLWGDVNGDGKINITDVNRLFRYTTRKEIHLTDEQLAAADITHDGKVNVTDVNRLFKFVTKQIETL